jgi:hypothetical protein
MTQDEIIEMAVQAGMNREVLPLMRNVELLTAFATIVIANNPPQSFMSWQEGYEAGKQTEREAIARMIEDAPPLVEFAKNDQGGCMMCGFTPKLAAYYIRARNTQ